MNLIIQHDNVTPNPALDALVETRLRALSARQYIEEAIVNLKDEREASPRYNASIMIRIPGPDMHASSRDHTAQVAVQKALEAIEAQVRVRHERKRERRRSQLQQPATERTGRAW